MSGQRQITKEAISAFLSDEGFYKDNTQVVHTATHTVLKLYGNPIAQKEIGKSVFEITDADQKTITTKERLNGLPGVSVHQVMFKWFLNDNPWDGSWTSISQ